MSKKKDINIVINGWALILSAIILASAFYLSSRKVEVIVNYPVKDVQP